MVFKVCEAPANSNASPLRSFIGQFAGRGTSFVRPMPYRLVERTLAEARSTLNRRHAGAHAEVSGPAQKLDSNPPCPARAPIIWPETDSAVVGYGQGMNQVFPPSF